MAKLLLLCTTAVQLLHQGRLVEAQTQPEPEPEPEPCNALPIPHSDKASHGCTGTTSEICSYTCDAGYSGPGSTTCGTDGSFGAVSCTPNPCNALPIPHSDKKSDGCTGTTGASCSYTCDLGYSGPGSTMCGINGSFGAASCAANPCATLPIPHSDKASHGCTGTTGASCSYRCDAGYSGS
eukprot:SAG11_NODE_10349_length_837_cov_3.245257_1_plen_180_part_01